VTTINRGFAPYPTYFLSFDERKYAKKIKAVFLWDQPLKALKDLRPLQGFTFMILNKSTPAPASGGYLIFRETNYQSPNTNYTSFYSSLNLCGASSSTI
jgi:hypothetical protein